MPALAGTLFSAAPPKSVNVENAAAVVERGMETELDWVAARDIAVLLLLYGSGLRIAEALGIKAKDAPTGDRDMLRIIGNGSKERLVPVLPIVRDSPAPTMRCSSLTGVIMWKSSPRRLHAKRSRGCWISGET